MSILIEDINAIILKTLPNVSEETCVQLISILQNCGVESKGDLRYVRQEDICEVLPVIQLRKLLEAFKLGKVDLKYIIRVDQWFSVLF